MVETPDDFNSKKDEISQESPNNSENIPFENSEQPDKFENRGEIVKLPDTAEEVKDLVSKLDENTETQGEQDVNISDSDNVNVPGKLIDTTENRLHKFEEREIEIDGTKFRYVIFIRKKDGVIDNCKVMDSFEIDDPEIIKKFIDEIFDHYPDLLSKRDKESYCWEWLAHNFLYKLHILRIATRDVDMDIYTVKLLQKIYRIMGSLNLSIRKNRNKK